MAINEFKMNPTMKIITSIFLFFCLLQSTTAQVSGRLITAGGQSIERANILLLKSTDSTLVKATITNDTGIYRVENIAPGKYMLRFSSAGYQTLNSMIFEINDQA